MGELIGAWLPLVIIIIVFGLFSLKAKKDYKRHVDEVNNVNQQIVDTNKEMIGVLEEIRDELRKSK